MVLIYIATINIYSSNNSSGISTPVVYLIADRISFLTKH